MPSIVDTLLYYLIEDLTIILVLRLLVPHDDDDDGSWKLHGQFLCLIVCCFLGNSKVQ